MDHTLCVVEGVKFHAFYSIVLRKLSLFPIFIVDGV